MEKSMHSLMEYEETFLSMYLENLLFKHFVFFKKESIAFSSFKRSQYSKARNQISLKLKAI